MSPSNPHRNPGDPDPRTLVERVIRVDQAGEFGAVRIYEGQLAAMRWSGPIRIVVRTMPRNFRPYSVFSCHTP